jgi:phospholipid N-methyltransferase
MERRLYMDNSLPLVEIDEDFYEHLHEMGYDDQIEVLEFIKEWNIWTKENCI